jgi:hypothetical protein
MSGSNNTEGNYNVFIGFSSGRNNSDAANNVFIGCFAGNNNTTGSRNTFFGYAAGYANTTGSYNIFIGDLCGEGNTTGNNNLFIGSRAGRNNTTGFSNLFFGINSGTNTTTGNRNVFIGAGAGNDNITGYQNIFIGDKAGYYETGTAKLFIESSTADSSGALIWGDFFYNKLRLNAKVAIGRNATTNDLEVEGTASKTSAGDWLASSDSRIKTNIREIDNAIEIVEKLHPVKFNYTQEYIKNHKGIKNRDYYNFIAQEYKEVFPESVKGSGEYLENDEQEILQLDSYNAQIVTIKAVQDIIKENKELKDRVEKLEQIVSSLLEK